MASMWVSSLEKPGPVVRSRPGAGSKANASGIELGEGGGTKGEDLGRDPVQTLSRREPDRVLSRLYVFLSTRDVRPSRGPGRSYPEPRAVDPFGSMRLRMR